MVTFHKGSFRILYIIANLQMKFVLNKTIRRFEHIN